jgi:hypothetical protein
MHNAYTILLFFHRCFLYCNHCIETQALGFMLFYEMSIPMSSGKPSTNIEHTHIHKKLLLTSVGYNIDINNKVKKEEGNPNLNI